MLRKLQRCSDTHSHHLACANLKAQQLVLVLVGVKDLK